MINANQLFYTKMINFEIISGPGCARCDWLGKNTSKMCLNCTTHFMAFPLRVQKVRLPNYFWHGAEVSHLSVCFDYLAIDNSLAFPFTNQLTFTVVGDGVRPTDLRAARH